MTTALTIRPTTDLDDMSLGKILAQSGYFADTRDAAQAIVKILAGRELGFGPIASMSGVYIINGKPALSANLMAAAIKRSGKYTYRITRLDDTGCELVFYEAGQPLEPPSVFTVEDAKKADALTGKNAHTWKKFPRNMLFARALSNGARWHCPDIFGGPIYTPEEMDAPVNEEGEVLVTVAPAPPAPPALVEASTEPPPPPPATNGNVPKDPADAERRFFAKFGTWLGGTTWEAVQQSGRIDAEREQPTTVEQWVELARQLQAVQKGA